MGWKMVTRTWYHIGLGHGGQTGQSWPPRRSQHIAHPFLFSLGLLSLHAFFCSRFSRFSTSSASSNFSSNFQHLSTVLFSKDPSQGGWQLRTGLTNMSPSRVKKRYFALPVTSSVVSLYQMHQTFWWSFRRFFESPTGTSREWLGTRLAQKHINPSASALQQEFCWRACDQSLLQECMPLYLASCHLGRPLSPPRATRPGWIGLLLKLILSGVIAIIHTGKLKF